MSDILEKAKSMSLKIIPCGSRVTCNPPPMDTDIDYLVLVDDVEKFSQFLLDNGFFQGGSSIADEANTLLDHEKFISFSNDDKINFIVTLSSIFYDRFVLATEVCKTINELRKQCRIVIFQAILYGKLAEQQQPLHSLILDGVFP